MWEQKSQKQLFLFSISSQRSKVILHLRLKVMFHENISGLALVVLATKVIILWLGNFMNSISNSISPSVMYATD